MAHRMRTRFTGAFGTQHPIVQGSMRWAGATESAGAFCAAGGLGMTALTQPTTEELSRETVRCPETTDRSFGGNLILPTGQACIRTTSFGRRSWSRRDHHGDRRGEPRFPQGVLSRRRRTGRPEVREHAARGQGPVDGRGRHQHRGSKCAGRPGEDDVPGLSRIAAARRRTTIPVIASGDADPSPGQGANRGGQRVGRRSPLTDSAEHRSCGQQHGQPLNVEILGLGGTFEDVHSLVAGQRG